MLDVDVGETAVLEGVDAGKAGVMADVDAGETVTVLQILCNIVLQMSAGENHLHLGSRLW